jgi:hypothetical protein
MVDSLSPVRRQHRLSALSLLLLASSLSFDVGSASLAPQKPTPKPDYGEAMKDMFNTFSMKDENISDDEAAVDYSETLISSSRQLPPAPPSPPLRADLNPVAVIEEEEDDDDSTGPETETETWKSKAEWWKDPLSMFEDDEDEIGDESESESLPQEDTKSVSRPPFGETLEEILEEALVNAVVAEEEEDAEKKEQQQQEQQLVVSEEVPTAEDAPPNWEEEIKTGMLAAAASPPVTPTPTEETSRTDGTNNAFSKLLAPAEERETAIPEESSLSPSSQSRRGQSSSSSVSVATPLSLLAVQLIPKAKILLQVLPAVEVLTVCTVVGGAVVAKFLPKLAFLSNINSSSHKSDMDMDDQDIIDEYRNKQKRQRSRRQKKEPTTQDLDSDDDFDERAADVDVDVDDQDTVMDLDDIRFGSRSSPPPENDFFEMEHEDTSRSTGSSSSSSSSGTRRKRTKRRRRTQTSESPWADADAASTNDSLNQIDESDVSSAAFQENLNKNNNRKTIGWPKFTFRNPLPYRPPAGELALSKRELAQSVQDLKHRVTSAEAEKTNMEASYEQASWQLQETTTELAGSKQTTKYLQAQLRDNEEMLERVVRSERHKAKEELMKMKEAMVKVVEREREAMRDEFMKQAAELQTLWQEQNENEESTVSY